MTILNVAEKNDAGKHIAKFLSNDRFRLRRGPSRGNPLYDFHVPARNLPRFLNCNANTQQMTMTSVSGHLMCYDFAERFRDWGACNPIELFDCPIEKNVLQNMNDCAENLRQEARTCNILIIWTDCDREGENIGFQIAYTCRQTNPSIQVYRATFSDISTNSCFKALETLGPPNENLSDAAECRQQLDLRVGIAFSRWQTRFIRSAFRDAIKLEANQSQKCISYGPCQFPTMGFCVKRWIDRKDFQKKAYYTIKLIDRSGVRFSLKSGSIDDPEKANQIKAQVESQLASATITNVQSRPKSKYRPFPLDTVSLEIMASRKLRMSAKQCMHTAEKLYLKGLISYVRTETNIWPRDMDFHSLVQMQTGDNRWGFFAKMCLDNGFNPKQGRKSDNAHPPIHPMGVPQGRLNSDEEKLYEFVVRRFLASISADAMGAEQIVTCDVGGIEFQASGQVLQHKNYSREFFQYT